MNGAWTGEDNMKKIGLIAGGGTLPIEFIRAVKKSGDSVVVFALVGMASPEIEAEADRVYWLKIGQFTRFIFLLFKERIRDLAMLGKVSKTAIYQTETHDVAGRDMLRKIKDRKDYSILKEVTRRLKHIGVEVVDAKRYLAHLSPGRGILSRTTPNKDTSLDIRFGYDAARRLADMDVGQTVIVKGQTIVALEAMEGTDSTIERAADIAGPGCVMVKVSRTKQDMRWDVPTVGPSTMERLIKGGYSAIAIESGSMFLLEKERFIRMADEAGIIIEVI
jgi:UDP-2,3-diacylglucosamine hydrolase